MHEDFCIVSDRPEILTVDEQNRPHSDTGPFCRWRDGTALYSVHGVRVPAWIVERPQDLTCRHIDKEQNAEVRRVMVERYGMDRYMRDGGARCVDEGRDGRRLFRKEQDSDEPLVMVELVNSTPEPDGHHKKYLVRVPPTTTSADQAAAWINWEDDATKYQPVQET
jgi:hypothetical protein